jgi:hypothetical protein
LELQIMDADGLLWITLRLPRSMHCVDKWLHSLGPHCWAQTNPLICPIARAMFDWTI